MSMPTWEGFMMPTLRILSDGVVRSRRDIYQRIERECGLTDEQIHTTLSSGQRKYQNRIGWALSRLTNVGALHRPSRSHYCITAAGSFLVERFSTGISEQELTALGDDPTTPIRPYATTSITTEHGGTEVDQESSLTPFEQVQIGVERIRHKVAEELLRRLQEREPAFFEQAVVDLLLAMGYGGTNGRGSVTQLTNDAGIDGVIDQDILGLSRVYVQAKRYATGNGVGRPDLQGFVGALHGRADSGVFITTSHFSAGARDYAAASPTRIVLIDGKRLTDLMIQFGVGVQTSETYTIVDIDEDFFA